MNCRTIRSSYRMSLLLNPSKNWILNSLSRTTRRAPNSLSRKPWSYRWRPRVIPWLRKPWHPSRKRKPTRNLCLPP